MKTYKNFLPYKKTNDYLKMTIKHIQLLKLWLFVKRTNPFRVRLSSPHSNLCNEPLEELLPMIFKTWSHTNIIPKVHISST